MEAELLPPEKPPVAENPPNLPTPSGVGVGNVDVKQAIDEWEAYLELTEKMLVPADYQKIPGKKGKFKKKSAARKYARAFRISDSIIDQEIVRDENNNVLEATFIVLAWLPDGRTTTGLGNCSRSERKFSKPNHDIIATAHTRAKNRAIFDLIGSGEVSAEEMYGDEEAIKAAETGKRKGERPSSGTPTLEPESGSPKGKTRRRSRRRKNKDDDAQDAESEMPKPEKVEGDYSTEWEALSKEDRSIDYVVAVVKEAQLKVSNVNVLKAAKMLHKQGELKDEELERIVELSNQPAVKPKEE